MKLKDLSVPIRLLLGTVSIFSRASMAMESLAMGSAVLPSSFVSEVKPSHSLHFMQPKLCDPDVVQYSGYMEIDKVNHYFFWFFESRNDPAKSPLTAWVNGGPGCSSMIGLWEELGPCRVNEAGTEAVSNPHSWNQHSNLLFFDQPDNVGFSYGRNRVYSSVEGATLAYEFLQLFYEAFPKYSKQPFHFFGESYGGHYVPEFAKHIVQKNKAIASSKEAGIYVPLKSIGIGNGWTNALIQYNYSATMACDSNYGPVLSQEDCTAMRNSYPECARKIEQCLKTGRNDDCVKADTFCNDRIDNVYANSHRSYYDIRISDTILDPPGTYIQFLNNTRTRDLIGAKTDYKECPEGPYNKFAKTGDNVRNMAPSVAYLLNSGVQVLLYSGDADYICNWHGNYAWSSKMNFKGRQSYHSDTLRPWNVSGVEAGQVQSGGNLTFIRVYEAGHEVPYYQPVAALDMFNTWIKGDSFRIHQ